MNDETPKIITNLDKGAAKPIPIDSRDAIMIARQQNNEISSEPVKEENNFAEIIPDDKDIEIDVNRVNHVNDLVKVVDVKYSKKTVIILAAVLVVLIAFFLIFELPMLLEL